MVDSKDVISVKIEKINDTQIRCTLTSEDLADRQLKLSELAYGSEKAKDLFRDMMLQAQDQFGFEADNVPLMIEAIPITPDSIVLIITKVEDPEELDTRFSRFSPASPDLLDDSQKDMIPDGADEVLDLFQKLLEHRLKNTPTEKRDQQAEVLANELDMHKSYLFHRMNPILDVARILSGHYHGENSLYKNPETGDYYLLVSKSDHKPEEFNKVCNILSEYGTSAKYSPSGEAYMKEHYTLLMEHYALQQLALI